MESFVILLLSFTGVCSRIPAADGSSSFADTEGGKYNTTTFPSSLLSTFMSSSFYSTASLSSVSSSLSSFSTFSPKSVQPRNIPLQLPLRSSGFIVVAEGKYDHEHHTHAGHGHEEPIRPRLAATNASVEAFLGSTAKLDCTVHDMTNESVSWLRSVEEMLELLTWETHTYSKDNRYSLRHESGEKWQRWQLVIRDVETDDAGQYRCQVATKPAMVLNTQLVIIEPRVRVVDERGTKVMEKHYNSGSMIELQCVIEFVPFPHRDVTWRRGNKTLSFNTSIGGINVKGDPKSGYIRSKLYVANATPKLSGIYSCWYSNYSSDDITVHVIAGENSAGLQHDAIPEGETEGESQSTTSGGISIFQSHSSFQLIGAPRKRLSHTPLSQTFLSTQTPGAWKGSWFDEPFSDSLTIWGIQIAVTWAPRVLLGCWVYLVISLRVIFFFR